MFHNALQNQFQKFVNHNEKAVPTFLCKIPVTFLLSINLTKISQFVTGYWHHTHDTRVWPWLVVMVTSLHCHNQTINAETSVSSSQMITLHWHCDVPCSWRNSNFHPNTINACSLEQLPGVCPCSQFIHCSRQKSPRIVKSNFLASKGMGP